MDAVKRVEAGIGVPNTTMFSLQVGDVKMEDQREFAKQAFIAGVNFAKGNAEHDGFLLTVLADLMQIQCLQSGDMDLLRFTLPSSTREIVDQVASHQNASSFTLIDQGGGMSGLVFQDEDEQDKFIQAFEMLSFRGMRAYPTPDVYLGQRNPDQKLCADLLEFLNRTAQKVSPKINSVFVGAIHLQAKIADISDFGVIPKFEALPQPTRCYLIGYTNGYWKFIWSKPGQFGIDANFITPIMKEDPSQRGERYFNDAIQDAYTYSTTLTLTTNEVFDGQGFMYKQVFDGWTGAFMGAMNPTTVESVPQGWMALFVKNAP